MNKNSLFIVFLLIFWSIVLFAGFPPPFEDDLFHIGAAINIAQGSELTNPLIPSWNEFSVDKSFYFYPPFYTYYSAIFLKIFGINSFTFLLIQSLGGFTFSLFLFLIADKKFKLYNYSLYLIPLIVFLFFFNRGLRPEITALALMSMGIYYLSLNNLIRYGIALVLIFSSVLFSPYTLAYSIPFFCLFFFVKVNGIKHSKKLLLVSFASLFFVFILFLIAIDWKIFAFLKVFFFHISIRRPETGLSFIKACKEILSYWNPVIILPRFLIFFGIILLLIFKKKLFIDYQATSRLVIAIALGIFLNLLFYSTIVLLLGSLFALYGVVTLNNFKNKKLQVTIFILLVCVIIASSSLHLIEIIFGDKNVYLDGFVKDDINNSKVLCVDDITARYLFDYKLPYNSKDWHYLMSPPGSIPLSMDDKKEGEVWIIAKYHFAKIDVKLSDYKRIEVMGRKFGSLPKRPNEIMMIK